MPNITFNDFRALATRDGLEPHQRIDDPLNERGDKFDAIVGDILEKLPALRERRRIIVDIGPGCGELPARMMAQSRQQQHRLWLIDSPEMLAHIPSASGIIKVAGKFPDNFGDLGAVHGKADAVLAYSMLHYVFEHDNVWEFLDRALALLAPGGRLLLGDVPNWSKRKRHFAAGNPTGGVETRSDEIWPGGLTDAVLSGLLARATEAGFDAYLTPQPASLPWARRRVDLLFDRPG